VVSDSIFASMFAPHSLLSHRGQFNKTTDFVIDINNASATTGAGGVARSAGVAQMPTLWGEGIALVQLNLEPCGINTLHTHPRASEFTYVVEGEKVYMHLTMHHDCVVQRCTA
jgi:Cupin